MALDECGVRYLDEARVVAQVVDGGLTDVAHAAAQAAHQLEGSEIVLQKMGVEGVPTLLEYLTDALGEGQVLAVDGVVTATSTMKELQAALAKKGASVKSVDLVEGNWPDRPAVPASEASAYLTTGPNSAR